MYVKQIHKMMISIDIYICVNIIVIYIHICKLTFTLKKLVMAGPAHGPVYSS
ncbi:hypothetical protein HanHA89_Chr12g0463651 [Helianthus annuus]|nr:hypothetical protein HanHA89_Chr12g0463651 [Helianthus annuus]